LVIYKYFFGFLKKNKIKLYFGDTVLVSQFFANIILVSALKKLNIPIAVWIHGGVWEDENLIQRIWYPFEIQYCDYYFVYGPKQIEILKRFDKTKKIQFEAVGCRFIEKGEIIPEYTKKNDDLKILFVIKDFIKTNDSHLNWDAPEMFSNNYYYFFVRDAIKILKKTKKKIIIKGHHQKTKYLLNDLLDENIEFISQEKSLQLLLNENVIAVYDFISTSIFEAIYSLKDIILHTKFNTDYETSNYLSERIEITNSLDKFEKKVDFYLSNELDKNKKDNFMKFFIVNETSDKNLNKLFGFLERIIKPR